MDISMETSSNERHRIIKAINGCQGMSGQDAIDEKIDNGIDEDATKIALEFNDGGTLIEIYNNGKPMDSDDMRNLLCLDSESKTKKEGKKGCYGIGGFNSNCVIGGQGKVETTTFDGNNAHRMTIHFDNFKDTRLCPDNNVWTGEHEYRPKWHLLEGGDYKIGVTIKFFGVANKKFDKTKVIPHLYKKYHDYIKKGGCFVINWGDDQYIINTPIFNEKNIITNRTMIDIYEGVNVCKFKYGDRYYKASFNKNFGTVNCGNGSKTEQHVDSKYLTTGIITTRYPDPNVIDITYNNKLKSGSQHTGYVSSEWIKKAIEALFNIEITHDRKMILPCGLEIELEHEEEVSTVKTKKSKQEKAAIPTYIKNVLHYFNDGLFINYNFHTLTLMEKFEKDKELKSGDFGDRLYHIPTIMSFDYFTNPEFNLSQEDKNKVDLPECIEKVGQRVCKLVNKDIGDKVKELYYQKKPIPVKKTPDPAPDPVPVVPDPAPVVPDPAPDPIPVPDYTLNTNKKGKSNDDSRRVSSYFKSSTTLTDFNNALEKFKEKFCDGDNIMDVTVINQMIKLCNE